MLKSNVIWPPSRRFRSGSEWEPLTFFSEGLCHATRLDLKLGFFSSEAIRVLNNGMAVFLYHMGRMRLIVNEALSSEDLNAIVIGESSGGRLTPFDLNDLNTVAQTLSVRDRHFFECMAWLIRMERLEIKIVRPRCGIGIAHSKTGIFSDGINRVAFDGSCNFSGLALLANNESISAFCDWDGSRDEARVADIETDFEHTFSGMDETVTYLPANSLTDEIKKAYGGKELSTLLKDEQQLIADVFVNGTLHPRTINILNRAAQAVRVLIQKREAQDEKSVQSVKEPAFPYGSPRPYQEQAFEAWKKNGQRGLFAMATGTGKTLTALNCLLQIYRKSGYYKALVLVPTLTLVNQWEEACEKFGFKQIIKVCSVSQNWREDLNRVKTQESLRSSAGEPSYVIIATYASFSREATFSALTDFSRQTLRQILLIADEAHNMGSPTIMARLDGIKILRRIGLSATPERRFDEHVNERIMEFFGASAYTYTFEFSMREAINSGYLCRYYYYPHLVRLSEDEMESYKDVSLKLAKLYNNDDESFQARDEIVKTLLLRRKRIIHKARRKEEAFRQIIEARYRERGNLKYTLVYVPEGARPDDDEADRYDTLETRTTEGEGDQLIDRYTQIIKTVSPVTTVKKFVSGTGDRDRLLAAFASGELEVLTSMKCLDEGVDVPRSELAIFCASTGNPRQFIQRRGRILRTHPDKRKAIIHDLVVAPEIDFRAANYKMERGLLSSELMRVRHFASLAENAADSLRELEGVLNYYKLSIF